MRDIGKDGPGAAVAASEIPIVEVDSHAGHTLEPEWKRLPIGPDSILYPVLVGLALFPILMGDAGHHLADDMPDEPVLSKLYHDEANRPVFYLVKALPDGKLGAKNPHRHVIQPGHRHVTFFDRALQRITEKLAIGLLHIKTGQRGLRGAVGAAPIRQHESLESYGLL